MATKVITGKCRASYAHLFEPYAVKPGNTPKYSVALIIPKSDTETIAKVNAAIDEALQDGIANKWGGRRPGNLKLPLHDGDTERPDDPAYANSYYINATSAEKPGVVSRKRLPITDPSVIYSGCYIRASVSFYAYDTGGKGVAAGLNNVQFWCDGEPLNNRMKAEDEFDSLDDDDDDFLG